MRVFYPVGWDGSTFIWHTPSWTRSDHPGHEIHLDRDKGWIVCSCESSVYGSKGCCILDAERVGCKHVSRLAGLLLRGSGRESKPSPGF